MYVGGGLLVLAIPVMGIVEVLAGNASPLYTYEVTQGGETTTGNVLAPALAPEGAEIVGSPVFDPNLRATLVALGLVVFGLFAIYRLIDHRATETESRTRATTAD